MDPYRKLIVLYIVLAADSLATGLVLVRRQVYLYRLTLK
ncbi:sortase B protein-sorting domain-containing protein [Bacillus thuringiensis]|nr:sortase B protein-sorting domain-containing protein [Bacillus thuringiensis]QKQ42383.1 sortase B protein-sorting domain-containing protein [Bacillus thuringiensis]HDR8036258.1 sortase B protein-sorting domain-containing protein [Bacillus cereus]